MTSSEVYVDAVRRRRLERRIVLIAVFTGLLGLPRIGPHAVWADTSTLSTTLLTLYKVAIAANLNVDHVAPRLRMLPTLIRLGHRYHGALIASRGLLVATPALENLARYFPNMAPREFGGVVLLPGTSEEAGPTTVSHEGVHADISNLLRQVGAICPAVGASGTLARIGAGLLPDDLNPEEELAYRAESPRDPFALKLRRATRAGRRGPIPALLRRIYGDEQHSPVAQLAPTRHRNK